MDKEIIPQSDQELKLCTACKEPKALSEFNWQNKTKGKRQSRCQPCCKKIQREYYLSNIERQRERGRTYYANNLEKAKTYRESIVEKHRQYLATYYLQPEVKARRAAANRKRQQLMSPEAKQIKYDRNKEKILTRNKEWLKSNPEKLAAWRKRNSHRFTEYAQRRRAKLKQATIERIDRNLIIERDKSTCYLCGKHLEPKQVTIDHVIPLNKGGSHTYNNLKVACRPCNGKKKDQWLSKLDWAKKA